VRKQHISSDGLDTVSGPSISLEPPTEDMDTDQTFNWQVHGTSFSFASMNSAPKQSFVPLPGIMSDKAFENATPAIPIQSSQAVATQPSFVSLPGIMSDFANATSAAPTQSSQAVAPHDHMANEGYDQMDCDEEQFDTATTLQPASTSTAPNPDAHPAQVEKDKSLLFNNNISVDSSASSQNGTVGSNGVAKPIDTNHFSWDLTAFPSVASTTPSFRYEGKLKIDFGADTSDLSKLAQKRVVPQQPLQQSTLISPPTQEQQPELLTGATHTLAKDVDGMVQPESAGESVATSSDVATRPEVDDASLALEEDALSIAPEDGTSEAAEAVLEDDETETV
jgi:hypothetical protein